MPDFVSADSLSLSFYIILLIIMYFVVSYSFYLSSKCTKTSNIPKPLETTKTQKPLIIFNIFLLFFTAAVSSGFLKSHPFPFVPFAFLIILVMSILFSFSKYGFQLAQRLSFTMLVGFQIFRIPLELVLHHWSKIGTVPETMTWTGQNFDIISGVIALVFIPFVHKNRFLPWIPLLIGFLLLMNVLRVVVMSSPLSFAWPLTNPLQLIFYLPYAYIGPLFVAPALVGHLLVFRKLMSQK